MDLCPVIFIMTLTGTPALIILVINDLLAVCVLTLSYFFKVSLITLFPILIDFTTSWLKPTIIQKKKQKEFLHNLKKGNSEILFHTGVYSNSNDEIDSISNYESFKYLFMPMEIITSINNYKLL